MDKREFKDRLYERFAAVAKAMASPKRVELLELLAQAERTVEWLAQATGMTVANTSQHLQVLRGARLVDTRKEGLHVHYRLASPAVEALWGSLRAVAEDRDAEVERLVRAYFGDRDGLEPVVMTDLLDRARSGEVLLIDVRPVEEFEAAHIAGARSVPMSALDDLAAELPAGAAVVAYCRGPYCVFADDAVRILRERGVDARRLEGGLPEWRAAGLPVASGRAAD
jgi:rhodanese-related sulfurtransferase/DNA-binding transcriptional ArsR family regulator